MATAPDHMLAEVSVEETTESLAEAAQRFYRNNRDVILIVGAVVVVLWLNKRSLRRELKRLNFNVEVYPDYYDTLGNSLE